MREGSNRGKIEDVNGRDIVIEKRHERGFEEGKRYNDRKKVAEKIRTREKK